MPPRQTGKTSSLLALRDYINAQGGYIAVYANVEAGQAARNTGLIARGTKTEHYGGRTIEVWGM